MPIQLLPDLKDGHSVPSSVSGKWNDYNRDVIDKLSKWMDIAHSTSSYVQIDSIPDVWARPILFEMALYDKKHLLHERIVGEWRGMLAMLALKEIRVLSALSVKPITIPVNEEKSSDFMKVLKKLLPTNTLDKDTSWSNMYVILFNNKVIGLTSPSTLVCTATECNKRITNVPWFDGKVLVDPVSYLNDIEKRQLIKWLDNLSQKLIEKAGEGYSPLFNEMLDRIGSLGNPTGFVGDLLNSMSSSYEDYGTISDIGLGMTQGIFKLLNFPVGRSADPKADLSLSNVRVMPSREKNPDKVMLYVDENMWGKKPSDVTLYGSITLATISFLGSSSIRKSIGDLRLPKNIDVRLKEDIFTSKLFLINQAEALPGSRGNYQELKYNSLPVTPLLPIQPELLNYISVEDLNSRIRFDSSEEGITVYLRLPLASDNYYEISKFYSKKSENDMTNGSISFLTNVPLLTVWPNLAKNSVSKDDTEGNRDWKAYYTYCRRDEGNSFYAKPLINVVDSKYTKTEDESIFEVFKTEEFPDAMLCYAQSHDVNSLGVSDIFAGIILTAKPREVKSYGNTWTIGIDFGTAGTTVYYKDDNGPVTNFKFSDLMLRVTDAGTMGTYLYDEFLPPIDMPTPFLSIFDSLDTVEANNKLRPLLDGHIFFLEDFNNFKANDRRIKTNLKWGGTKQRAYATVFLRQLCLQCAAEAVNSGAGEISWRYSFPTALPPRDKADYMSICDQLVEYCSHESGIKSNSNLKMTESLAAARYFLTLSDLAASDEKGFVCLDIGGGTTDISIWQKDNGSNHRLQTSLRFAGRDILIALIQKKPSFLRRFGLADNVIQILEDIKQGSDDTAFYSQAEAIIANKGEEILKAMPTMTSDELSEFGSLIGFAISGILYYIGLLIKNLSLEKGAFENKIMPDIYFGGNGSRILNWASRGNFTGDKPINKLFKEILFEASGFNKNKSFYINLSPKPKAEAAYGLVKSTARDIESDNDIEVTVISGEEFKRCNHDDGSAEVAAALESITKDDINQGIKISSELSNFKNFMKIYNKNAASAGLMEIKVNEEILDRAVYSVNQQLSNLKDMDSKDFHVDPLFIHVTRTVLEMKANEWSKKYK